MAANIWIIPDLKIWQFSCTTTTSFIILYHEQPTFGWFSCKNHSRFKVDNFPGWLWVMIFVWQISCMAVNFFWQISGMAVRSEIRLTIFLFFVLKLVDNFTIWQNYRNPFHQLFEFWRKISRHRISKVDVTILRRNSNGWNSFCLIN